MEGGMLFFLSSQNIITSLSREEKLLLNSILTLLHTDDGLVRLAVDVQGHSRAMSNITDDVLFQEKDVLLEE